MMRRLRERRQVGLLDRYWARLTGRDAGTPPDRLDPTLATVADRLADERTAYDPTTATIDRLWNRLEASTAVQGDKPRAWTVPTIGPNSVHSARRRAIRESEEVESMPASTEAHDAPPARNWTRESLKIAAAVAIFAVIGVVLIMILRDDDDPQTALPLPTATPAAVASATAAPTQDAPTPTQAAVPTPTVVAIVPTATVSAVSTLGAAFSVSITDVAVPEGFAYLDIERQGWEPFGGSGANGDTVGTFLRYQEAGVEACGGSPSNSPKVGIYRADGSGPEPLTRYDQPATLVNPGDHVFMPVNTAFNCRNTSAGPSLAWAGGVLREDPGPATGHQILPESVPPGSTSVVVAGADAPGLPAGEATFTLARVVLEPGDTVPGDEPAWTLIYAEFGAVSVVVGGATEDLAEGESTLVAGDAGYELVNVGDAAIGVIVLSVMPEGHEASAISGQLERLPEGSNYISLERHTWKSFGFTSEPIVAPGPIVAYQVNGGWSCFAPNEPITLIYADGSTEAMSETDAVPTEMAAGDGFLLAKPGSYNCVNGGQGDATQYQFTIYNGDTTGFNRSVPDGITLTVLAGGPVADLPAGPVALSIERVIVEPGATVPSINGVAATVFIEAGTAMLSGTVGGETLMHAFTESAEQLAAGVEAALVVDDGVTLPVNNTATITNTGTEPLVIIVATIVPAG